MNTRCDVIQGTPKTGKMFMNVVNDCERVSSDQIVLRFRVLAAVQVRAGQNTCY